METKEDFIIVMPKDWRNCAKGLARHCQRIGKVVPTDWQDTANALAVQEKLQLQNR